MMRVCITSADNLARRSLLREGLRPPFLPVHQALSRAAAHGMPWCPLSLSSPFSTPGMPDPFAIINVDGEHFRTAVARKTLSPQWMTERDMYISPVSGVLARSLADAGERSNGHETLAPTLITTPFSPPPQATTLMVFVFDSKRFKEGQWEGFLGMTVIPATAFLDNTALGEGATKVLNFRLRKRRSTDVVTGTVCVKVRILSEEMDLDDVPSAPVPMLPRTTSPTEYVAVAGGRHGSMQWEAKRRKGKRSVGI